MKKSDPPLPQGAEIGSSGVRYRVWAPACERVDVEICGKDGEPARLLPMTLDAHDYYHVVDEKGRAGDLYKFRLDGDPARTFPDPASRWQPQSVHGPSMVIDPHQYRWRNAATNPHPVRDLVIYELHVGTFTREGTFLSAIEKLPCVRDLGATAIEIMPIAEFPGARNWGYDGAYLYAPSRAYGHPDDLRALVDAAHDLGFSVMLDVVYNHFGPDGNYLAAYIGEYLDEERKTPWGGAIRYGDPRFRPLRALIAANPVYWMREFHFDGFRLDATHAIIDDSPQHLLAEITSAIHEHGGFAIAEDSRNDSRLVLPVNEGGLGFDGVWADDFHHTMRVSQTREDEGYLADFAGSLPEIVETLRHGWFYRGQYSSRRVSKRGTECRHLPPERFVHCISNHDQIGNRAFGDRISGSIPREAYRAASALICLTPYTPLLFMGQEWAASTPFLFFTDHNAELGKLVTAGRREEFKDFKSFRDEKAVSSIPDPQAEETFTRSKLDWEETRAEENARILELYRTCLALRAKEPAFRPASRDGWQIEELACGIGALRIKPGAGAGSGSGLSPILGSSAADWLLLFNFNANRSVRASLADEWICRARDGAAWSLVLSTNEGRFGGSGSVGVDPATLQADFTAPELLVLKA